MPKEFVAVLALLIVSVLNLGHSLSPASNSDRIVHHGSIKRDEVLSSDLSVIAATPFLISDNRRFIARISRDGRLVVYDSFELIFEIRPARNKTEKVSFLRITEDGAIELYSGRSLEKKWISWRSNTGFKDMCYKVECSLVMEDDGNLAAYRGHDLFWSSGQEDRKLFQNFENKVRVNTSQSSSDANQVSSDTIEVKSDKNKANSVSNLHKNQRKSDQNPSILNFNQWDSNTKQVKSDENERSSGGNHVKYNDHQLSSGSKHVNSLKDQGNFGADKVDSRTSQLKSDESQFSSGSNQVSSDNSQGSPYKKLWGFPNLPSFDNKQGPEGAMDVYYECRPPRYMVNGKCRDITRPLGR